MFDAEGDSPSISPGGISSNQMPRSQSKLKDLLSNNNGIRGQDTRKSGNRNHKQPISQNTLPLNANDAYNDSVEMLELQHNQSNQDLVESGLGEDLEPINFYKQRDSDSVQYIPAHGFSQEEDSSAVNAGLNHVMTNQGSRAQSRQSIKVYSSNNDLAQGEAQRRQKNEAQTIEYATAPNYSKDIIKNNYATIGNSRQQQ